MVEESVRLAVIGCGKVAQNVHLPALAKSIRCELVAVCDASAHVAYGVAARYGIARVYTDVAKVLQDELVDAVLVAVGDPGHVSVALQAIQAGKHVLVEKPLGISSTDCEPLREAVRRSGCVLQVGVMKRCEPGIACAKGAIADIGPIHSFGIWYRASADPYVDETSVFLPVIRDPEYRRPAYKGDLRQYYLVGHGAHLFDLVRYLLGEPVSVQADLAVREETYAWHGLLRLADGAIGHFDLAVYVESDWAEGLEVYGAHGTVRVSSQNPFFLRPSRVSVFDPQRREWREPTFTEGDPYLRQLDAFAESVLRGKPVVATVEDGIAALELIEAVATSTADGGSRVHLRSR